MLGLKRFPWNISLKVDQLFCQIFLNLKTFTVVEAVQEYVRQYTNTKEDHKIVLERFCACFQGQAVLEIKTTDLCQLW